MTDPIFERREDSWYLRSESIGDYIERTVRVENERTEVIELVVNCPHFKTLCWALNELAKYEDIEGKEAFCDYVVSFGVDSFSLQHHLIEPGLIKPNARRRQFEEANDITLESSEFVTYGFPEMARRFFWLETLENEVGPPELPTYIDIQYVEMGYAIRTKYTAHDIFYGSWMSFKAIIQRFTEDGGTNFGHIPNKYGFLLGVYIADNYVSIGEFVREWCDEADDQCRL